jgi:hypothetical protein
LFAGYFVVGHNLIETRRAEQKNAKFIRLIDAAGRELQHVHLARGLLHAGEGKVLFDQEFLFASAVSTYYSLFHLGAALILAYCSHPSLPGDPHAAIRGRLEEKWLKRQQRTLSNGEHYFSDPAGAIAHDDVPLFLEQELPEIFASLGLRDRPGTLRDMREFVSYAPRMLNDGRINVLYSGCQYEPPEFKRYLGQHILRVDEFFSKTLPSLIPSLRVSTLTRLVAPPRGRPLSTASHLARTSQIDQQLPNPFAANTRARTLYIR